jgi:hypothetical protein
MMVKVLVENLYIFTCGKARGLIWLARYHLHWNPILDRSLLINKNITTLHPRSPNTILQQHHSSSNNSKHTLTNNNSIRSPRLCSRRRRNRSRRSSLTSTTRLSPRTGRSSRRSSTRSSSTSSQRTTARPLSTRRSHSSSLSCAASDGAGSLVACGGIVEAHGALAGVLVANTCGSTSSNLGARITQSSEVTREYCGGCGSGAELRRCRGEDSVIGFSNGFTACAVYVLAIQTSTPVGKVSAVAHALLMS